MKNFIQKYKTKYYAIGFVKCATLDGESVYFNNYGFNHLIRKRGIRRYAWDVKRRLLLLKYAEEIIISKSSKIEYKKDKNKFWSITNTVGKKRIKIILRKIGKGKIHFYSIFEIKN